MPYSAEQMFDLVADVGRYAEFLPWVAGVRVRSDDGAAMVADLLVGFKGLRERFTSRVTRRRPGEIRVDYVEGPLAYLRNDWTFRPTEEGDGCIVSFTVDFAFRSRLFETLAGQVFDRALRRMIVAFEARAEALYGAAAASSGISRSSATSAA